MEATILVRLDVEESAARAEIEDATDALDRARKRQEEEQRRAETVTPKPPHGRSPDGGGPGVLGAPRAVYESIRAKIDQAQATRFAAERTFRDALGYGRMTADALGILASTEEAANPSSGPGNLRAAQNRLIGLIAEAEAAIDALRPAIEKAQEVTKASLMLGGNISGSEIADMLVQEYEIERIIARQTRLRSEAARQMVMREFAAALGRGAFGR
jgi:hypothetical protein